MAKNTKSVKNKNSKIYLLIATLFLIIAIVFGVFYLIPCRDYTKFTISDKEGKEKVQLKLEIADTNEKRLNGRNRIGDEECAHQEADYQPLYLSWQLDNHGFVESR